MAITFPSSPSLNDTYTVNGRTYVWNGTSWRTVKGGVPDVVPTLSVDNDFSAGGTLHVDSVNNEIGIGTAAPSHQLHLTQDLGVDGNLIVGGTITVPTPTAGTNDTKVATTEFVQTAVSGLVDAAPATLDTLNELAAALGDDANFATTVTNSIATKQDASTALTTSTTFGGNVSGTYSNIVIADDSHNHTIANVDNLQTTLDGKAASSHTHSYLSTSGGTVSGDLSVTGRFQIGGHYIDDVAGSGNPYGSINVGGAMTWDGYAIDQRVVFMHDGGSYAGLYNDVNNHWMVYCTLNGGVDLRYQGGTKFYTDSSGSVTSGRHYATGDVDAGGNVTASGGNGQIIMSGTNQQGAMYFSGGASSAATGAIEASWRNTLNPSIAIGVARDYDRTRFEAAYNGYAIIYVDNTERLRCTTGGVTYNGSFGASSIRIKENVRDASSVEGYTPADRDTALDKLLSLRPVVYDLKEHAHDKLWVGCDEHDHRFACEEAGCVNNHVNRVEHVCGQGWCYGTLENPCPKYTGTRNKLHFIAEEVYEVYGDHGVGFNEMREVESVDHQSLYTEHINVTQHLIRYVRELEQRISELEAV